MKRLSNAIILETPHIIVEFDGVSSGYSLMWSKTANPVSIEYTEQNGVDKDNLLVLLSSSDSFYLSAQGSELYESDFTWISYIISVSPTSLYGKNWLGNSEPIECVRSVSSGTYPLSGGRHVSTIEFLYFPTIDGKGLHKKVSVQIGKTANSENIDSIVFGSLVGVSNANKEKFDIVHRTLDRESFGFNYDDLAAMDADWTFDAGITRSFASSSPYPNVVPDFDSADWVATGGTKNSATSYSLVAGDKLQVWIKQAIPVTRLSKFVFDLTAISGQVLTSIGFNSNLNTIEVDNTSTDTTTGIKSISQVTGATTRAVYIEILCQSGTLTVENLCLQFKADTAYIPYDGSILSNQGYWNCLRITGSSLAGKKFTKVLGSTLDVSKSSAIGLWLLPMNGSVSFPSFRLYFKDADGQVVYSSNLSIWVDYNERYPNIASNENYWDDGFYFELLPAGLTHITEIGIEILTNDAIDWVIDDIFAYAFKDRAIGNGAYSDTRLGLTPPNTRIGDRCLSNYVTAKLPNTTSLTDKIKLTTIANGLPPSYYAAESSSVTTTDQLATLNDVYELVSETANITYGTMTDKGHLGYVTMPANCFIVDRATNDATGDSYRVLNYDHATQTATLDIKYSTGSAADNVSIGYFSKLSVDPTYYIWEYSATKGQMIINWLEGIYEPESPYDWIPYPWVEANGGRSFFVNYDASSVANSAISMSLIGDRQVRHVARGNRDIDSSSPYIALFSRLFLSEEDNTLTSGLFTMYPHIGLNDDGIDAAAENAYESSRNIDTNSRVEPMVPTPKCYNVMPHISFGGEFVAEDPMDTISTVATKLSEGNISNVIVGGGSLATAKNRVRDYWFGWASAVMDNGVSYTDAVRKVIRNNLPEEVISDNISSHRYLMEITLFNYKWLSKHRDQIAIAPDGTERFKRVWYYETAAGDDFYVVQHATADFDSSYYLDQIVNSKTYIFSYHYVMNYPALWTSVTSGSDWGGSSTTIFDLWMLLAETYCKEYDCEGVIFSEYIMSYKYGCSPNDFILYNNYRVANSLAPLADWVREAGGDVQVDDAELWDWKVWQTNQAVQKASKMVRSHGKLLSMSTEVEPIISVNDHTAPVWDGYTFGTRDYAFGTDPVTTHYHIRDLSLNCRRYGQDYAELFKKNMVDFGYVWLYHRYSPEDWWKIDPTIVDDFIDEYSEYKERLQVGIGLYPRRDPPVDSLEVQILFKKLFDAGFNVVYPGWPRIVTIDKYQDMWSWFKDYIPAITHVGNNVIEIDPKGYKGIPFFMHAPDINLNMVTMNELDVMYSPTIQVL